jgi:hypothetical protein
MQLLIFLKTTFKHTPDERAQVFKQFRAGIKQWKYMKLLKELDTKPQVLIETPDDKQWEAYDHLRTLDIVETIDSIVPRNI